MTDQTGNDFGAIGSVIPTRRLVPVYLAPPERVSTGLFLSGLGHGIILAALLISAAHLFGRNRDVFEFPIAIQFLGTPDKERAEKKEEQLPSLDPDKEKKKDEEKPEKLVAGTVDGDSEDGEGLKTVPEISVPDVRESAIASAKLKARPADSGQAIEPSAPGGVSIVYDSGKPLTRAEESGGRVPEAQEALPTVTELVANPVPQKAEETLADKFRKQIAEPKDAAAEAAEIARLAADAATAQPERAAEIADLQQRALAGDAAAQKKLAILATGKPEETEAEIAARKKRELAKRNALKAEKRTERWKRHIEKNNLSRKITEVQQQDLNKALRTAIKGGNIQRIETLLQAGANPYAVDAAGKDAIIAASWRGRELVVAFLLDQGIDVETSDREGRTPLAWASINGYAEVVRELLRVDANPNSVDYRGLTPLMRAAWNGHYDVVKILVKNGADVFLKDQEGKTALNRAEEERWPRVIKYLNNHIARLQQN